MLSVKDGLDETKKHANENLLAPLNLQIKAVEQLTSKFN